MGVGLQRNSLCNIGEFVTGDGDSKNFGEVRMEIAQGSMRAEIESAEMSYRTFRAAQTSFSQESREWPLID